jgi:hypothetical protein
MVDWLATEFGELAAVVGAAQVLELGPISAKTQPVLPVAWIGMAFCAMVKLSKNAIHAISEAYIEMVFFMMNLSKRKPTLLRAPTRHSFSSSLGSIPLRFCTGDLTQHPFSFFQRKDPCLSTKILENLIKF